MLFFQGQMPPRTYERSLQLLLLRQQGMKCCSVRVGTERERGEVCVVAQQFIFLLHRSGFWNRKKKSRCSYVCVYIYAYFSPVPFICIEEEMKSNLSDLFSGTIGYFSSFPRFATAFCLEILLMYPSSSTGVAETEERMLGCSAAGICCKTRPKKPYVGTFLALLIWKTSKQITP